MKQKEFFFEIRRKSFHLYSVLFPIIYLFLTKLQALIILILITAFTIYVDISRHYNHRIKVVVDKFLSNFMRDDEKSGLFKLSSASYMALGFFLSALFFSKGLAITSWFILAISDCIAALVGMRFGTPTRYGKSFAGSIAFFTSAVLISTACYFFIGYQTSFFTILISSAITSGLEFYSKHIDIDDNILIPLAYCFVTSVFVFISSL